MKGGRLLLVEDEPDLVAALVRTFTREGHLVESTASGREALDVVRLRPIDLVVLDLGLPDIDGLDVCRQMRDDGYGGAILMLTARSSEMDRVVGLDSGADDYLSKPFMLSELLARVRSLLRRGLRGAVQQQRRPDLRLDRGARRVFVGEEELVVTTKEFDLLAQLEADRGRVVTRSRLMTTVWDDEGEKSTKTLDVTVGRLRAKLREAGARELIVTVRAVGYRLDEPDPAAQLV